MGATLAIWEDLLEDTSFGLFAIHSHLEDYTLAYALNGACAIRLKRQPRDLELDKRVYFPFFYWKDEAQQRDWTLVRNSGSSLTAGAPEGLFPDQPTQRRHYLLPEKREVDYFLKLEGEDPELRLLAQLRTVPQILTAYRLQVAALKSKQNLIF